MKRLIALICALCCVGGLFGGCQTAQTPNETLTPNADYQVKVVDAYGNPYTIGVIVQYMKDGKQVAMQPVNDQGIASKNLPRGQYTVELMFTDKEISGHYDRTKTMTETVTTMDLQVYMLPSEKAQSLHVGGTAHQAYSVSAGGTYVTLNAGMNYFLFSADMAGTYKVSAPADVAELGYYGAPHFVQANSALPVEDNTVTISIKESMLQGVYVFGLNAQAAGNCVLKIEWIGEPRWDVSDEPWTIYKTTANLSAYTLPKGAKLTDFDVTAKGYELVLNSQDGFYHLNTADGPLVVVYLGVESKYLDSFQKIADNSSISRYFYDENGNFLRKESYNECLMEYFAVMDENAGVYPLTEDLKYIIQQRGEYYGWWKSGASTNIFVDSQGNFLPDINTEIAWLFACAYISQ